jgi:energy-converting hydrogenase Eha subunit H
VARAIYGLIVAMSILAVWSVEHDPQAGEVLESLAGTAVIFWLAHVYAAVTEEMLHSQRRPTRAELRTLVAHEWPLVEVAILPALVIGLAVVGAVNTKTAINVALYLCLAELAATGFVSAWRTGTRGWAFIAFGGVSVLLGMAIVLLKTLTH